MYAISLRLYFFLFATVTAASTALFGGNFPLAQGVMPIFCAVLLILSIEFPAQTLAGNRSRWMLAGIFIPLILVLGWAAVQILPFGGQFPALNPFWRLVEEGATWTTISATPGTTVAQLVYSLGLLAAAWSLFRAGQNNPTNLLRDVAAIITLACTYGIIMYALGNGYVMWLPKTSYQEALSGPFINRNSFATFAGLGILANMGLMLQRVGEISSRLDTRQRIRAFILLVLRPGLPWAIMALVCFLALVLTNSRAGITASLCGMLVLLGSLAGMRAPARWPLAAIILSLAIVSAVVLSAVGASLGSHLQRVGEDATLRQNIYTLSGDLAAQYPYTGTGFGTFAESFATVRTPELLAAMRTSVEHAHNTYIELAAELGYPAFALLALSAFSFLTAFLNGLRTRRRAIMWPALGVATLTLVGGHALADFSLSIPAVALTTIAMLMAALGQSMQVAEKPTPTRLKSYSAYAFPILAVLLLIAATWQTAANYQAFRAEPTVTALSTNQPVSRTKILIAQARLQKCLSLNPYHPTCGFDLAQTNLSFATGYGLVGDNSGVGLVYLNMARTQYADALNHAPLNPWGWYRLARIDAFLHNRQSAGTELTNSLLTGPAEPNLTFQRIPLLLAFLPESSEEDGRFYASSVHNQWLATPWLVAPVILANPATLPVLAWVIDGDVTAQNLWTRYIKMPLPQSNSTAAPASTPLGATPKKR